MDISKLRGHLKNFQFNEMFVSGLGWENPTDRTPRKITIEGHPVPYTHIAEISSIPVLKFSQDILKQFENDSTRKKFHKEIKSHHHKHLALFSDDKSFFYLSYLSKDEKVRTHSYFKGQSGDYFISKLAGIHFGIEDEPNIAEIGNKLEKAFNAEEVTKKFFENFKDNHNNFLQYIDGIENEEEKKWYASLILNRLMFIWFLQKKEFVDKDFNYLETKLEESRQRGKDHYYSEFLTLLFFEGFAKKPGERSPKAKQLLGNIKYLNGGLFVPHPIEEKYKNKIKIQDKAFEETFKIFNQYDWHLQGKEGKSDNEISPDVMGYIFEKYINELQQKSLGAYYTRDEITSYLSRNTIQKCVLEKVNNKGHIPIGVDSSGFFDKGKTEGLLRESVGKKQSKKNGNLKPDGYKFETIADMLHKLDASLCKLLLTDEDSILNTLTILDPAVGSGAFLVSAMKELIDIYSPIIGRIETLGDRDLTDWLNSFKEKNKSVLYGIKKNIILKNLYGVDIMKEATEVCKLRLFLSLVSSAMSIEELEPLPNMDFNIMCGNSLIGFLKEEESSSPQSFDSRQSFDSSSFPRKRESRNKTKNSIKHKNLNDSSVQLKWEAVLGESYSQIKERYNQLVSQYKNKALSFKKLKELKRKILNFLNENNSKLNRVLADKCNREGLKYQEITDIQGKKKKIHKRVVRPEDFYFKEDEKNLKPFHWDFAFNKIMNKGGFDIIITNPPWEKVKIEDREFFHKYNKDIDKKRTTKKVLKRKKTELLKDPHIKQDYWKTEEYYLFQRDYFSKFYQYQSGKINNRDGTEKQASADMDTYRLFVERYFDLLDKDGFLGVVLPSGLHKDDGAIGLRKELLFKKTKIEGLIDFQNQMEKGKGKIFEGVDSRFKFLLLNLKKDKPQDQFPCQFHERDLSALDENQFPKVAKMKQSIKEIKKLSPRDCSIIEFKDPKDKEILKKAEQFLQIGKTIPNSWNPVFYTEFHETNDSHLFKDAKESNDDLPLYVGKAIYQYAFNHDVSYVNRYVDSEPYQVGLKLSTGRHSRESGNPDKKRKNSNRLGTFCLNPPLSHRNREFQTGSIKLPKDSKQGFPFQNRCYKNYRLVIRTIASNTNERSLIAAVIPKNHFISNSLYGVYIESGKAPHGPLKTISLLDSSPPAQKIIPSRFEIFNNCRTVPLTVPFPDEQESRKKPKNLNQLSISKDTGNIKRRLEAPSLSGVRSSKTFHLKTAGLQSELQNEIHKKKEPSSTTKSEQSDTVVSSENALSETVEQSQKQNYKYMLLLQAFLNSFTVDYFIRQKVSANINKKYIISLHIPRLTEKDPYFKELVERSAKLTYIGEEFNELADEMGIPRGGVTDQQERWKIQGEIDAMVAYVYGLALDEFEYILGTFTTGKNQERLKALKRYALDAFKKNQFLNKTS